MKPMPMRALVAWSLLAHAACSSNRAVPPDDEETAIQQTAPPQVDDRTLSLDGGPVARALVGERCTLDSSEPPTLNSAALGLHARDCATGACLRLGLGTPRCTASCATEDDCPAASSACASGFICAAAFSTTASRCCTICICRDDDAWITTQPKVCAGFTPDCSLLRSERGED